MLKTKTAWSCPSNIALVKYWGKRFEQIPQNSSISFTLNHCVTKTSVECTPTTQVNKEFQVQLQFESNKDHPFAERIKKYLQRLTDYYPKIPNYDWRIESENSFPHSSGIASSASSFAALACCVFNLFDSNWNTNRISEMARLGSGSASRSVIPFCAVWGAHPEIANSKDEWAVPFHDFDPMFKTYKDSILIVSDQEKAVSSSMGHKLMEGHVFEKQRYYQANTNLTEIKLAMQTADLEKFIKIVEEEALSLHGLMMNSNPSFILMKPNTLQVIERIRAFRRSENVPVCFTLDAGPNVHVLYPSSVETQVIQFIEHELNEFFIGQPIHDGLGAGAVDLMS